MREVLFLLQVLQQQKRELVTEIAGLKAELHADVPSYVSDPVPGPCLGLRLTAHPEACGCRVIRIAKDSLAEVAGLIEGDIVMAVGGIRTRTLEQFALAIQQYENAMRGCAVMLEVRRWNHTLHFSV